MKVLVLGASGRLGRQVVNGLIDRDNQVRAFIHHQNSLASHRLLELVCGDVHDSAAVEDAVRGVDTIIATLGSATAPIKDVSSIATKNLIAAMSMFGARRIVSVTGSAAWRDRERNSPHPHLRARREQLMTFMPELILDGEKHIRLLEDSDVDWTVIRAPLLRDQPGNDYVLSIDPPPPIMTSSYRAVATAIIDQLVSDEWVHAAPFIF